MAESESVKKSKILVFGQIGEELAQKSKERLMCCIHHDPSEALSDIAIKHLHDLFEKLKDAKGKDDNDKLKKEVIEEVKLEHDFREFSEFFHEDMDELSKGSAIMGELKQMEGKLARLKNKKDDLEAEFEELDDLG